MEPSQLPLESTDQRIANWERSFSEIQKQDQHAWAIRDLVHPSRAQELIDRAWALSDHLQNLAERIERQAEKAQAILDDVEQ